MNPGEEDPIVSEVRAARDKLVEQAGGDLDRLIAMLQEMETRETRPVVGFSPRKPSERAAG
jgi:hypothetical protein